MLFSLFLCSIDNSNRYIIDSDIFIDSSYRLIWWVCEEDNSIKYHNHSYSNTPGDEITTGSYSSPMNYHFILMDSCLDLYTGGLLYFMSGRISLEYLTMINCRFDPTYGLIIVAGGSKISTKYAFVKNCSSSYYIIYYNAGGTITFYDSIIFENHFLTVSKFNILTSGTPYFQMICLENPKLFSPLRATRPLVFHLLTYLLIKF